MAYRTRRLQWMLRPETISGRSRRSSVTGGVLVFWIFLIHTSATFQPLRAQEASEIRVGMNFQKNADVLPGFEISYAPEALFGGHPRFSLALLTSRPSAALGSRVLLEDRFLLGAAWFFRPGGRIDPYIQLEAGYTRFERENSEIFALLDNDAMIASILVGTEVRLFESRFSVVGEAGYSILHSSTVYPFVASVGIHYSIQPRTPR